MDVVGMESGNNSGILCVNCLRYGRDYFREGQETSSSIIVDYISVLLITTRNYCCVREFYVIAWASAKIIMEMPNKCEKNFVIPVTDVCDILLWKASHSNFMKIYVSFRPMRVVEIRGTDGT
jgi:hypothetical protein